jgi:hypothetical protein
MPLKLSLYKKAPEPLNATQDSRAALRRAQAQLTMKGKDKRPDISFRSRMKVVATINHYLSGPRSFEFLA